MFSQQYEDEEMPEEAAERLYNEWLLEPEEVVETKAERREQEREKRKYGPIRHGEGSTRVPTFRSPKIRVNGKQYHGS